MQVRIILFCLRTEMYSISISWLFMWLTYIFPEGVRFHLDKLSRAAHKLVSSFSVMYKLCRQAVQSYDLLTCQIRNWSWKLWRFSSLPTIHLSFEWCFDWMVEKYVVASLFTIQEQMSNLQHTRFERQPQ